MRQSRVAGGEACLAHDHVVEVDDTGSVVVVVAGAAVVVAAAVVVGASVVVLAAVSTCSSPPPNTTNPNTRRSAITPMPTISPMGTSRWGTGRSGGGATIDDGAGVGAARTRPGRCAPTGPAREGAAPLGPESFAQVPRGRRPFFRT